MFMKAKMYEDQFNQVNYITAYVHVVGNDDEKIFTRRVLLKYLSMIVHVLH